MEAENKFIQILEEKMFAGKTIDEMVAFVVAQMAKNGLNTIVLPSRLNGTKFVLTEGGGADDQFSGVVSTLDLAKHGESLLAEVEDFKSSLRLFDDKPVESSVHGVPMLWIMKQLHKVAEQRVEQHGDSVTAYFIIDGNGLRQVEPPLDAPSLDASISLIGREHRPELVVVAWGGFIRSLEPPYNRTGIEIVGVAALQADGQIFASISSEYGREDGRIVWKKRGNTRWKSEFPAYLRGSAMGWEKAA